MEQANIANQMGWLSVPFWLVQGLDIELYFLQGKDNRVIGDMF